MENTSPRKQRALSCIQPSGVPTLGNYLGALRNWVGMQDEFECFFAVADLHAITVRQEPSKLRQQIRTAAGMKHDRHCIRAGRQDESAGLFRRRKSFCSVPE